MRTKTWHRRRCSPSVPRWGHVAGFASGCLFVFGGSDGSAPTASLIKIDCAPKFPQKGALSFKGDGSQYCAIKPSGSLASLSTSITIEAMIYPHSLGGNAPAVCKTDNAMKAGFGLIALDDATARKSVPPDTEKLPNLAFFFNGFQNRSICHVPANEWSHIACTYDGHTITIYHNGKRVDYTPYELSEEDMTPYERAELTIGALRERVG